MVADLALAQVDAPERQVAREVLTRGPSPWRRSRGTRRSRPCPSRSRSTRCSRAASSASISPPPTLGQCARFRTGARARERDALDDLVRDPRVPVSSKRRRARRAPCFRQPLMTLTSRSARATPSVRPGEFRSTRLLRLPLPPVPAALPLAGVVRAAARDHRAHGVVVEAGPAGSGPPPRGRGGDGEARGPAQPQALGEAHVLEAAAVLREELRRAHVRHEGAARRGRGVSRARSRRRPGPEAPVRQQAAAAQVEVDDLLSGAREAAADGVAERRAAAQVDARQDVAHEAPALDQGRHARVVGRPPTWPPPPS